MTEPIWNKTDFEPWLKDVEGDEFEISINEYGPGPIVIEITSGDDTANVWATPSQARELAAKLIEAADAAERAGQRLKTE